MRDYQPHKNNPYWLPNTLYRRVLVTVRDYDRMVTEYKEIVHETASGDGQPRSSFPGDPVERKIERMVRVCFKTYSTEGGQRMCRRITKRGCIGDSALFFG